MWLLWATQFPLCREIKFYGENGVQRGDIKTYTKIRMMSCSYQHHRSVSILQSSRVWKHENVFLNQWNVAPGLGPQCGDIYSDNHLKLVVSPAVSLWSDSTANQRDQTQSQPSSAAAHQSGVFATNSSQGHLSVLLADDLWPWVAAAAMLLYVEQKLQTARQQGTHRGSTVSHDAPCPLFLLHFKVKCLEHVCILNLTIKMYCVNTRSQFLNPFTLSKGG